MKKILFLSAAILLGSPIESYAGPWEAALSKASQGKADWAKFLESSQYKEAHGKLSRLGKPTQMVDGLNQAYDAWRSPSTPSKSASSAFSMSGASSVPFSPPASTFSPGGASSVVSSVAGDGRGSIPEILKLDQEIEGLQDKIDELEDEDDDVKNEAMIKTLKKELRAKRKERKAFAADGAGAGAGGAVAAPAPATDVFSIEKDGKIYSIPKDKEETATKFNGKTAKQLLTMIKLGAAKGAMINRIKEDLETAGVTLTITDAATADSGSGGASAGASGGTAKPVEMGSYDVLKNLVRIKVPRGTSQSSIISPEPYRYKTRLSEIRTELVSHFDEDEEGIYEEAKKIAEAIVKDLNEKGKPAEVIVKPLNMAPARLLKEGMEASADLGDSTLGDTLKKLNNKIKYEIAEQKALASLPENSIRLNPEYFSLFREGFSVSSDITKIPLHQQIRIDGKNIKVLKALKEVKKKNVKLSEYIDALHDIGITINLPEGLTLEALKKQAEEHATKLRAQKEKQERREQERLKKEEDQEFKANLEALGADLNIKGLSGNTTVRSSTLYERVATLAKIKGDNRPVAKEMYKKNKKKLQEEIDKIAIEAGGDGAGEGISFEAMREALQLDLRGKSPDNSITINTEEKTVKQAVEDLYNEKAEMNRLNEGEKMLAEIRFRKKIKELRTALAS